MSDQVSEMIAERRPALAKRRLANDVVTMSVLPPASRLVVRGEAKIASDALGMALPTQPNRSKTKGARIALGLGPDEWLVIGPDERPQTGSSAGFSSVDVSHRNIGYFIEGDGAVATLNASCPRDLSLDAFPVGASARTVLGKAEAVIWRTGEDAFRVECWRSFAPYLWDLLADAAGDAAL